MIHRALAAVGAFFGWLLGWIPRTLKAALNLTGEERQTLMSWGLLGGVIVLTAVKLRNQEQMHAHWVAGVNHDVELRIVDGLFDQLGWDTILQGVLVIGIVAIARGGSMTVSASKGNLTIDFQASGQAARQLAQDTSVAEAMSPTPAPGEEVRS